MKDVKAAIKSGHFWKTIMVRMDTAVLYIQVLLVHNISCISVI